MNVSRLLRVPLIVLYRSSSAEIIFSIRVDWSGLFFSSGLLLLGTRTSQPLALAVALAVTPTPAPVFAARRASPATAAGSRRGRAVRLLSRPVLRCPVLRCPVLRRPVLRRPVLRSSAGDSVVSRAPAAFGESARFSGAWPTAGKGRGFSGKPGGRTGSQD